MEDNFLVVDGTIPDSKMDICIFKLYPKIQEVKLIKVCWFISTKENHLEQYAFRERKNNI